MRRGRVLAGALLFSFGLLHCVGDEPSSSSSSSDDGGGGGGSGSDASTQDVNVTGDGASASDASDAGNTNPPDQCVGFTDCPTDVEPSSLQLWLRGGFDVTCEGGRIAHWKDESGKGHDATPGTTAEGDAGTSARCGAATINGIDVAAFGAPAEVDAGKFTQFVDETLDVNLDFTTATDYTFFVVEERTTDAVGMFFGRDDSFPPGGGHGLACNGSVVDNEADLYFGYFDYPQALSLSYSQGCSSGQYGVDLYAASTPLVDELVFTQANGHVLYSNGIQVYVGDHAGDDLYAVSGGGHGAIGRGTNLYFDTRFRGNIAEIIGYSKALSAPERSDIEGYLKRQWGLTF